MKFKIHKSTDNQFYWTLVGANGETLATSETYTRKEKCIKTINNICFSLYVQYSEDAIAIADTTKIKKAKK